MLKHSSGESVLSLPRFWVALALAVIVLCFSIFFVESARVSAAEVSSMEAAAQKLVTQNLDIATYMALAPLPIKAEYLAENYPEGVAPVESADFPSYESFSTLIKSTFAPSAAAMLLNSELDGVKCYSDVRGKLCRAVALTSIDDYDKDLSHMRLVFSDITKKSASIALEVDKKTGDGKEEIKLQMYKYDGEWLLKFMAF